MIRIGLADHHAQRLLDKLDELGPLPDVLDHLSRAIRRQLRYRESPQYSEWIDAARRLTALSERTSITDGVIIGSDAVVQVSPEGAYVEGWIWVSRNHLTEGREAD